MQRLVPAVVLCLVGACATTTPRIVGVRDISRASSPPTIERVVDLGLARTVDSTLDLGRGDGHGVIGELLLLRGDDFGKQPTVTIGGQPATVVAHTSSGGVVVRVPWGIDPGVVSIEVENAHGTHQATYPIERLAVVGGSGRLLLASVSASGECRPGPSIEHRHAERLAVSTTGATALVAGGQPPHLTMFDLTASPPARRGTHRLPGTRVAAVVVASHAPVAAAITDTHVVYVDQRSPGNLALYAPLELPAEIQDAGVVGAAISPRGKRLALVLGKGNQVALLDAGRLTKLSEPRMIEVLPGVPLELLVDVRFAADGGALWVVSGNNSASIAGGNQPTRLSLVRDLDGEPAVSDPIELEGVQVPAAVAMARGEPSPPGTTIRATSARSALFVGGYPRALLKPQGDAKLPRELDGRTARVELGKGATVLGRGSWLVGSVDVAGKTQVMVGLAAGWSAGQPARLLVSHRAWGKIQPRVLRLADGPKLLSMPLRLGQVRLQP